MTTIVYLCPPPPPLMSVMLWEWLVLFQQRGIATKPNLDYNGKIVKLTSLASRPCLYKPSNSRFFLINAVYCLICGETNTLFLRFFLFLGYILLCIVDNII